MEEKLPEEWIIFNFIVSNGIIYLHNHEFHMFSQAPNFNSIFKVLDALETKKKS